MPEAGAESLLGTFSGGLFVGEIEHIEVGSVVRIASESRMVEITIAAKNGRAKETIEQKPARNFVRRFFASLATSNEPDGLNRRGRANLFGRFGQFPAMPAIISRDCSSRLRRTRRASVWKAAKCFKHSETTRSAKTGTNSGVSSSETTGLISTTTGRVRAFAPNCAES
jgi:hypothetical protein